MIAEKDGMTLLHVPAGDFTMGSDNGESDEKPPHAVYLDAFWIDQTEVTNAMYAKCVQDGACNRPSSIASHRRDRYYGNPEFDNYPVIYVSWEDARAYCVWADRRLPTEAEWEKAARGENALIYPWGGDAPTDNLLNYNDDARDTTEVGTYPNGASPYGALDMAGNVWEWVADWYDKTYYAASPASNPLGPSSGQFRLHRGGAFYDDDVRSARRIPDEPGVAYYHIGFRCAISENKQADMTPLSQPPTVTVTPIIALSSTRASSTSTATIAPSPTRPPSTFTATP
jgi:serine/threonine-protein kinase